ncbi:hypothetical protein LPB87_17410 [Flavobacterium sp. EDS]|uniref:DUF6705 family protein n=1 Tax=Flavobacterium sp. EDS TaxID=2897328 RepID=UPI001E3E1F4F|nr:DUF6705 family protein [Flavobacterium sp. EDS]MCD0476174.1 hypothetical protein [Flavobacterium sp. EDS]
MKKILILTFFIGITFSCQAQILPIEKRIDYISSRDGIPESVTYFKDINNVLDKFVGTWKGIYDGKNYEFRVSKITTKPRRVTEDKLVMRYLITNSNGIVIEDTRALPDSSPYVIKGNYIEKNTYFLTYIGKNAKCGQKGTLMIDFLKDNSNTKMNLFFSPSREIIYENDCSGFKQIMPLKEIILTK